MSRRSTEPLPKAEDFTGMAEAMITFRRVVHEGSFTRAAKLLGATTSAVSKRISRLEDRLGVRLIERTSRSIALTEAGELFHERVLDILAAMDEAASEASMLGGEPRGTLRVSAPILLGERLITPLIASFHAKYPRVRVALELSDRYVSLVADGFDCAIRIGSGPDASLVSRKIGRVALVTVASPAYLARRGTPERPRELPVEDAIRYSLAKSPEEWRYADGTHLRPAGPLEVSHGGLARLLALEGLGVAALPHFEVADDLARGALVELLEAYRPPELDVHVVFPTRKHVPAKVRAFVEEASAVLGPRFTIDETAASATIVASRSTMPRRRNDSREPVRGRRNAR